MSDKCTCMSKKKICFVALGAYPLLAKNKINSGGGPEIHQTFLARELMKHNFEVIFITYNENEGNPFMQTEDGIKVIKVYNRRDISHLNSISKALWIWKAMNLADADIYYHHSGSAGIVSLFCRLNSKKSICHIASNACVIRSIQRSYRSYWRYWMDNVLADIILVQSKFQKAMLKKNFNRDSFLIKNFFPLTLREIPKKSYPPIILWVGSMAYVKQPWLFLKLAKKIPEGRFQMIGGVGEDENLYESLKEFSEKIHNLDFLGYIPFYEINEFFKRAATLVNTSKFEGYPNAFIQAWMCNMPVISLNFDLDKIIQNKKLGFFSGTFDQVVLDVKTLLEDETLRNAMGKNARKYVEIEHDIRKIAKKYIEFFDETFERTRVGIKLT